jgi:hypothetical protein
VKLVKPAVKVCPTCRTAWKANVEACPTCSDALAAVRRLEQLAYHQHSLPNRLADRFAGTTHPYDIADAIRDALAPEPQEEPLAEWERELLSGSEDGAS